MPYQLKKSFRYQGEYFRTPITGWTTLFYTKNIRSTKILFLFSGLRPCLRLRRSIKIIYYPRVVPLVIRSLVIVKKRIFGNFKCYPIWYLQEYQSTYLLIIQNLKFKYYLKFKINWDSISLKLKSCNYYRSHVDLRVCIKNWFIKLISILIL